MRMPFRGSLPEQSGRGGRAGVGFARAAPSTVLCVAPSLAIMRSEPLSRPVNQEASMATKPQDKLMPIGAEGAQLKQAIRDDKPGGEKGLFDPGASMLGTDDEVGAPVDHDEMAETRKAPPPPGYTK